MTPPLDHFLTNPFFPKKIGIKPFPLLEKVIPGTIYSKTIIRGTIQCFDLVIDPLSRFPTKGPKGPKGLSQKLTAWHSVMTTEVILQTDKDRVEYAVWFFLRAFDSTNHPNRGYLGYPHRVFVF